MAAAAPPPLFSGFSPPGGRRRFVPGLLNAPMQGEGSASPGEGAFLSVPEELALRRGVGKISVRERGADGWHCLGLLWEKVL